MTKPRRRVFAAVATTLCATLLPGQGVPNVDVDRAHHVLRRIAHGGTPAQLVLLGAGTATTTPLQEVQAYVAAQLNPDATTDPDWPYGSPVVKQLVEPGTGVLGLPATLGGPINQFMLVRAQVAWALASKWQLRELMKLFWDQHFNTSLISQSYLFQGLTGAATNEDYVWFFEKEANDYFRTNAFGNFRDLLVFVSQHVTMVYYLHLHQNVAGTPNEDYARELLELYTMSPEMPQASGTPIQNYAQIDVEEVARMLTGWSVNPAAAFTFQFNTGNHQYVAAPTTTLFSVSGTPGTIANFPSPNGQSTGMRLLAHLASRDATKDFICRKLINYFVGEGAADAPGSTLLASMKSAWGVAGDMRAVLTAMLTSNDFLGTTWQLQRARMPFEAVIAAARGYDGKIPVDALGMPIPTSLDTSAVILEAMGHSLFRFGAPNGFPTGNDAQMSPSVSLERAKLGAYELFGAPGQAFEYHVDALVQAALPPPSHTNFSLVIRFLLESLYGSNYTQDDETRVASVMAGVVFYINNFGTGPFAGPFNQNDPNHYWAVVTGAASAVRGMTQSGVR